ncbi:MBL fold metallo-hydrolase [Bradyrhizobium sp. LA7.1]|uniref:MBL fold metallo-hydrolase n=1 Tax=Bradyrhizobium sp. LA7.1 TaxID=3156324 RepID=UPI0033922CDD
MRPIFNPSLVNGRCGDPTVYVETLFEKHSLLFDVGEIASLSARKIQRVDQIFVSHAHIDHFVGFDHLLRLLVGHEKTVQLYGPARLSQTSGLSVESGRKLSLRSRFRCERTRNAEFHVYHAVPAEAGLCRGAVSLTPNPCRRPLRRTVSAAILEHGTPCLAFALREAAHVNIWKNRLSEHGLPVGPWLRSLKQAVVERRADDHLIRIDGSATSDDRLVPLGSLRDLLTVTAGQKIAYVTDVADTPANRAAITALVQNADILFIEAAFAEADVALARNRAHLTTMAAGEIARQANVRRVEPFHFSPRYAGDEVRMLAEVMTAFRGSHA